MERRGDERLKWALLLVLALIWGSSFILMKRGLFHEGVPVLTPFQLASARLAIAWLTLSPLLLRHYAELRTHWRPLLGSGLLGNGLPAFLFATAQMRVSSSLSGMLNSLTPLFALLIGVSLFGQRLRMVHLAGVLLGLAGAVGLIALGSDDGLPAWSTYALLPVVATVCYGASANIVKHRLYMLPASATSALALTFVGPVALVLVFASGLPRTLAMHPHGWSALGHVALLATLSSALALVLWNVLLKRTSALWASSVTYLMPVVAIGWGMLDGERLGPMQLAMIAVILAGVYLVNVAERR
jgi:drug/metabolite transporter (DMT)-like permease